MSLRCKIDGVLKVIRDARKNSPNHICPKRRSDFFFLIMYLEEKVEQEVKVYLSEQDAAAALLVNLQPGVTRVSVGV